MGSVMLIGAAAAVSEMNGVPANHIKENLLKCLTSTKQFMEWGSPLLIKDTKQNRLLPLR